MPAKRTQTSDLLGAPRSGAQTVLVPRVLGGARKALLRDRGNKSLRRRLSEGAPSRGAHAGDGFGVGGSYSRAETLSETSLLVVKSGGKEVSHIEKNSDLVGRGHVVVAKCSVVFPPLHHSSVSRTVTDMTV